MNSFLLFNFVLLAVIMIVSVQALPLNPTNSDTGKSIGLTRAKRQLPQSGSGELGELLKGIKSSSNAQNNKNAQLAKQGDKRKKRATDTGDAMTALQEALQSQPDSSTTDN